MPCRSDYMEPTEDERKNQQAAKIMKYLLPKLGRDVPRWIVVCANSMYGYCENAEKNFPQRCLNELVDNLTEQQVQTIVAADVLKTEVATLLASWYLARQHTLKKRANEKAKKDAVNALRKSALKKLTKEERAALGLKE